MRAKFTTYVNHAICGVLFAVQRPLAACNMKLRALRAGVMRAKVATGAHHAVLGMLFAKRGCDAALDIESR